MNINKSQIRALCFDVDGTISDTDDLWCLKIEKLLSPFRWLFPKGDVQPFARWVTMTLETPGNVVYHILDRLGLDDEVAAIFNWISQHQIGRKPKTYWIIPSVKETLIELSNHYPLAVVSARDEKSTLAFLDHFELTPLFQNITTAHTCPLTKPYPDPLLWCAQQMGVKPEECLMIGDTTVDIRTGKAAGAQTIAVLCGFGERDELERVGADMILESTADLNNILLS